MKSEIVRAQLAVCAIRITEHQRKQRNRKARSPSPKFISVPANPARIMEGKGRGPCGRDEASS